jgi:signal transduction histidine kinase/CheY-like chemotaxis protein
MNFAVIIGVAGALAGVLLASFSLGLSRSPAWPEGRPFALVAATAAGYCAFDLGLVLDFSPVLVSRSVQIALVFGVAHGVAWLLYFPAAERRPIRRAERWLAVLGGVIALSGLVPGLLLTREIVAFRIDWIGVTYHTPQPTAMGLAVYGYFCAALAIVAAEAWRQRHAGWSSRFPMLGVALLGLLALNDTLSSARIIAMPLLLDAGAVGVVVVTGWLHQRRFTADAVLLEQQVVTRSRELLEAQAALARSERMAGLGRLAAGVAHEINNPLAVVQHSLERLQRHDARAGEWFQGSRAYIENGLAAGRRIVRIVGQLLDAGRATGIEPTRLQPFAVAPVVRRALQMTADVLPHVQVGARVDERLCARGDAGMVEQVLVNLITNAAHALESRTDGARLTIDAERVDRHAGPDEDSRVRISVSDNGSGVPAAVRGRLFEPFVSTKPVGKGSGLGLAVSLGLMRSQQGDLTLVRTSSAGTQMALDLAWSSLDATLEPRDVTTLAPPASPSDIRVLIIDDDEDVGAILMDAAAEYFRVELAATLDHAFALIGRGPAVDVVLCDLMMPDGGAEAWLRRCAVTHPQLVARTVFVTGGPTTPAAAALVDRHRDRVLYKPCSMADMRAMVLRMVESPAAALGIND